MGNDVAVRVLGPVEVRVAGAWSAAGPPQRRLVLALTALSAGQVVPVADLIDAMWEEHPPRSARGSLQAIVTRLRQTLAGIGAYDLERCDLERCELERCDLERCDLEHCGDGYRLLMPAGLVDVHRFRSLARVGREATGAETALAALDEALGLWRGPALADVPSTARVAMIQSRLTDEHLAAVQDRVGWLLKLGRERTAAAELPVQLARYPLAERLAGLFMVALYRCGQRAGALRAFHDIRARLAGELGVEPGPELQRLCQRVLAADPSLTDNSPQQTGTGPPPAATATSATPATPAAATASIPRQLPAVTPYFAGRAAELSTLDELISRPVSSGVCVISGAAGTGKTALALHWAHGVAARFPDGQLYVNLRGFGPSTGPVTPGQAIRGFLHALGIPAAQVPRAVDEQVALYRSLLAGRRVLVILDNARDAGQARPLLGGSGCMVLVTSRSQLTGLVAAEGARAVCLDVMPPADAQALLARRLGVRAMAEPEAVTALCELCARLPLALVIAAARASTRPGFPLAAIAAELRGSQRLDCLDTGDPAGSVREVFSWSGRQLSRPAWRLFRLLGVHSGPDISAAAAASLAGVSVPDARRLLAELTRANLLAEHLPGRFGCHDLLRAYAAELAGTDGGSARQAHIRLLDHYLHTANTAGWLLYPTKDPLGLGAPQPGVARENPCDRAEGLAWFRAEQQVLLAAARHAAEAGLHGYVWRLAAVVTDFLNHQGHWHDLAALQRMALAAARRADGASGRAHAQLGLGMAAATMGGVQQARAHLKRAIALFHLAGDAERQARSHVALGWACAQHGHYREARRQTGHALRIYRGLGNRGGQALAMTNLGWILAKLHDYQAAVSCCERALVLHAELGNLSGLAHTWGHLGYARHCLGDDAAAITCYQRALRMLREASDPPEEAGVLTRLGTAYSRSGDRGAAQHAWQRALAILKHLHDPECARAHA